MLFTRRWILPCLIIGAAGAAAAALQQQLPTPQSPARPVPTMPAQAQVAPPTPSPPTPFQANFETYKMHLAQRAQQEGIAPATRAMIPTLRLNERAIDLDRAQRPAPRGAINNTASMMPYLRQHVTPVLISRGQSRYYHQWPRLVRIHAKYGVDPATLIAIYGKETSYGSYTGNFDLLDVLSSLAYEGRRRSMFEQEFLSALKLIDAGVSRERLRGSYAGAMGYPQFMPSVALRLRADGDDDGFADIWRNETDALASIANYLRDAGWKPGLPWGVKVNVPATLNRASIKRLQESPNCPAVYQRHSREMSAAQWQALGVVSPGAPLPQTDLALIEPEGPTGTGYLITANYRAILAYNCSNYYAMSVALLSDAIARR